MRDIGKIEDRVENLETLTSLSLLELDTRTLQVRDADGLDRFKSGFFVDDFADNQRMGSDSEAGIENNELKLLLITSLKTRSRSSKCC